MRNKFESVQEKKLKIIVIAPVKKRYFSERLDAFNSFLINK